MHSLLLHNFFIYFIIFFKEYFSLNINSTLSKISMIDPCPICEKEPCTCEEDYIYHEPTTGDTDDE